VDTRLGYAQGAGPGGVKLWPAYLCFMIFGVLIPFSKPDYKFTTVIYSLLIAIVVGLMAINVLILVFNSGNAALRQTDGGFAREAVGTGMLFMIPFTVLAIIALAVLGRWLLRLFLTIMLLNTLPSESKDACFPISEVKEYPLFDMRT
jgi:hypothetical protein